MSFWLNILVVPSLLSGGILLTIVFHVEHAYDCPNLLGEALTHILLLAITIVDFSRKFCVSLVLLKVKG